MDMLQFVGSIGGLGGVFAFLMFMVYKNAIKQMQDDRRFMEDRLTKLIDDYNRTSSDNTKVLWELITWLRAKNGSKD